MDTDTAAFPGDWGDREWVTREGSLYVIGLYKGGDGEWPLLLSSKQRGDQA